MKSAIQTLTDGLVYCENYLKENPNCSGQNKRIKGQQIIEHKKALKILTDIETSEANLTIPDVSKHRELLVFLEWYLQNRGRYSSSEPKYMVEEYLNQ